MKHVDPGNHAERNQTAHYIAGLTRELRVLAARSDMQFISFLLSMAADAAAEEAAKAGRSRSRRSGRKGSGGPTA